MITQWSLSELKNLRHIFDWKKQFNKVAYDCRSIEFKGHESYFRLFNLYMKHRTLMILHFLTIQTLKYLVKTLEYKSCFDHCCICYFYAFLFSRGFMKHSTKQYLVKTRTAVHTFKNCIYCLHHLCTTIFLSSKYLLIYTM